MRNIKVPATTLGLSFSEKFITSFYRVATSIQTVDDPISRRSHYLTDAERLHELWIYASSDVQRWLILVDEVLSGTNSRDRNLAVTSVLKDLHGSSSLCVVTTHELDIAINLAEQYDNFHFS